MKVPFLIYCALVVIGALAVTMFVAPLLWEAAGYVNDILENLATCGRPYQVPC